MTIKEYKQFPEEALTIRKKVFVEEQGFIDEFDEIDKVSKHLLVFEEGKAIATCRVFYDQEKQSYMLGRLAVLKEYRGKKIGSKVLQAAEDVVRRDGGESILLSSQERVISFYEKQGYVKEGDSFLDEGCPHIWVRKKISWFYCDNAQIKLLLA